MRDILTDEEVEKEIQRLTGSPAVKLARREQRIKYRMRQQLYTLRYLEKRGNQLMENGVTAEVLDMMERNMSESMPEE